MALTNRETSVREIDAYSDFPDRSNHLPVPLQKFPVPPCREFDQEVPKKGTDSGDGTGQTALIARKFPVFSLLIREFEPEQSSILTAHTASRPTEYILRRAIGP